MRILILFISFFSNADQLKPITEAVNDLGEKLSGYSENEIMNQEAIFIFTKCAGASLLMSDEEKDFWDKNANGFLRLSILADTGDHDVDLEEYTENIKRLNSKFTEIIYKKRDEYSELVRDINPEDFIGTPPAYALLNSDLNYCLSYTETELWKEVNFDLL